MSGIKMTAQQKAALALDRNIAVSAGAGSGKTRVLVERYITILQENPDLRPKNVVAITFTRKAAAEMRERIRDRFTGILENRAGSMVRQDRIRYVDMLDELPRAPIGTIHGFAADILREFAISAGLDPGFGILEDERSDQPGHQAAMRAIRRMETENPGILRTAFHFFDLKTLGEILQNLAGRPGMLETLERQAATPFDYRMVVREKMDTIHPAALLGTLAPDSDDLAPSARKGLAVIRESLGNLAGECEADELRETIAQLRDTLYTKGGEPRSSRYYRSMAGDFERLQSELTVLNRLASVNETGERYAGQAVSALIPLVRMTIEDRDLLRRQTSMLTFDDLEVLTWQLLTQSDEATVVRERLRKRYRYFMIDEFQDTNPMQWQMIRPLVTDDNDVMLPDRLFVVGDPKQSIYGFRNADVSVFKHVREMISRDRIRRPVDRDTGTGCAENDAVDCRPGGDVNLRIDWNFRSRKAILAFTDVVCGPVMTGGAEYEVEYEPLIPARDTGDDRPDDSGRVGIILPNPDDTVSGERIGDGKEEVTAGTGKPATDNGGEETSDMEDSGAWVELLAGHVLKTVEEGLFQWRDIAVMFPRRSRLDSIKRTFRLRGIPFVVYKGSGFWQQPEIRDLTALINWLADPGNRTALYTVLRSPLFNLSDAGLILLAHRWREFPSEWGSGQEAGRIPDGIVTGGRQDGPGTGPMPCAFEWPDDMTVQSARTILQNARDAVGVKPLTQIIEDILVATAAWGNYAVEDDSGQVIGNIEKYLDIITTLDREGVAPLWETAAFLTMKENSEEKEDEALMADPAGDSVTLLTVHAAKGLEFPVVYVIDMEQSIRQNPGPLIADQHRGAGLRLGRVNPGLEGYETQLYRELSLEKKKRENAERQRLMYVVFTRAKDRLYLVHRPTKRANLFNPSVGSNRWMDWIGSALNLTPADLQAGVKRLALAGGEYLEVECITRIPVTTEKMPVYPTLEDVSALTETPESDATSTDRAVPEKPAPVFTAAVTTIRDYLADRDEYVKKHVLNMVDHFRDPGTDPVRETARILGNTYHQLMELHPGLEPDAVEAAIHSMDVELAAGSEEDRLAVADRLRTMIDRTRQWPLHAALSINQGLHELPFNIYLESGIVHGIIDLLIRIDGRWIVVDYKTDRKPDHIAVDEWMDRHREEHRFQMSVYALAVRQLDFGNRSAIPVIVYFADAGADIRFEFSSDELNTLQKSLDATLKAMDLERDERN